MSFLRIFLSPISKAPELKLPSRDFPAGPPELSEAPANLLRQSLTSTLFRITRHNSHYSLISITKSSGNVKRFSLIFTLFTFFFTASGVSFCFRARTRVYARVLFKEKSAKYRVSLNKVHYIWDRAANTAVLPGEKGFVRRKTSENRKISRKARKKAYCGRLRHKIRYESYTSQRL